MTSVVVTKIVYMNTKDFIVWKKNVHLIHSIKRHRTENDEEVTLVFVLQTTKKLPTIPIHFKKLNTFKVLIKFKLDFMF